MYLRSIACNAGWNYPFPDDVYKTNASITIHKNHVIVGFMTSQVKPLHQQESGFLFFFLLKTITR